MKPSIQLVGVVASLSILVACTTSDKATPADTATGQATTIAPANSSIPVLAAPVVDTVPALVPKGTSPAAKRTSTAVRPRTADRPTVTASPKASGTAQTSPVPPMRDSARRPIATVDEHGNVRPIKRDSLK